MHYTFNFLLICTTQLIYTMYSLGSAWQVIAGVGLMTYTMGCFMAIVEL